MPKISTNSPEDSAELNRVLEVIDIVDVVVQAIPEQPEENSKMAKLDAELNLSKLQISDVLSSSMQQSVAAMKTIRTLLFAEDELFVPSLQSLLRTAFLGASRVNWVLLAEDDAELTHRARRLMNSEYKNLLLTVRNTSDFQHLTRLKASDELIQDIEKEISPIKSALGKEARLTDTALLNEMGDWINQKLSPSNGTDTGASEAITWLWNSGSGAAHAMGWPLLGRTTLNDGPGHFLADYSLVSGIVHLGADYLLQASTHPEQNTKSIFNNRP